MKKAIFKIVSCFLLFGIYSCGNNTNPPTPSVPSCRLLKLDANDLYYDSNKRLEKVENPNYTVYYTYTNNTIKEKYMDKFDADSMEVVHTLNSNGLIDNSNVSYCTFGNTYFYNAAYSYDNNSYLIKVSQSSSSENSLIEFTYNSGNITFIRQTITPSSGSSQVYNYQVENYNNFLNKAYFSDYIVKGKYISSCFLNTTNLFGKSVKNAVKTTQCCGQDFEYIVDSDSAILNGTGQSSGWGDIDEFARVCD